MKRRRRIQASPMAEPRTASTEERDWRAQHDTIALNSEVPGQPDRIVDTRGGIGTPKRVFWPIDGYHKRGLLTKEQWSAGDKLREDYERACSHHGCGTGNAYTGVYVDASLVVRTPGGHAIEAQTDLRMALAAVGLHRLMLVKRVCCEAGRAADWAAERYGYRGHKAEHVGMHELTLALDDLAAHYGIARRRRAALEPR